MAEQTVPETKKETPMITREITRNPETFVSPLVDIYETSENLVVVADLPGVEKDGVNVKIENGLLTIEGKVPETLATGSRRGGVPETLATGSRRGGVGSSEPQTLTTVEFELVNFFRQFELSDAIDQEKIEAELKHGVLTVSLPKSEKQKPRKIKVNVI